MPSGYSNFNMVEFGGLVEAEFQERNMIGRDMMQFFDMTGKNTLKIPVVGSLSAGFADPLSDRTASPSNVGVSRSLVLDKAFEIPQTLSDEVLAQNSWDLMASQATQMGGDLAEAMQSLWVNYVYNSTNSARQFSGEIADGSSSIGEKTAALIREVKTAFDRAKLPKGPEYNKMLLDPTQFNALHGVEEVSSVDYGGTADAKRFGQNGLYYAGFHILQAVTGFREDRSSDTTLLAKYRANTTNLRGIAWNTRGFAQGAVSGQNWSTQVTIERIGHKQGYLLLGRWFGDHTWIHGHTHDQDETTALAAANILTA